MRELISALKTHTNWRLSSAWSELTPFLRDRRQHTRTTHIVVERRGKREDDELELAFRRVLASSSFGITMPKFEIAFADKKTNSIGLQLADLTARPIGRHGHEPRAAKQGLGHH